jgi:hypothetical protein
MEVNLPKRSITAEVCCLTMKNVSGSNIIARTEKIINEFMILIFLD